MQVSVSERSGWLGCLFVAGISGDGFNSLFLCCMSRYCIYDSDNVATSRNLSQRISTYLTQQGSITLHLTPLFAKGA